MRNRLNKLLMYGVGLLLAGTALAAEVRMRIEPSLIDLLDRAVLKIDFINTEPESIELPEIEGLQFEHLGPSKRTVSINGDTTKTTTHSYVVTPSKTGTFNIGPVIAKHDGKEERLSGNLKVVKKAAEESKAQPLSDRMFARVELKGAEPYVYEPFELKYTVYVSDGTQVAWEDAFGRSLFAVQGGMPESGLDGKAEWHFQKKDREAIDGKIYDTYTFAVKTKTLKSGPFTFQPQVQIHWVVPSQNRRPFGMADPFMGDLFGRQEVRPYTLECNPLVVKVQPVPNEGRPASFGGGVGVFDFEVEVGPAEVEAGYPVTVKMRVTGKGNLDMLTPPSIAETPQIKTYESQPAQSDVPGEVRFEQVVIPNSEAVQEIPAITFSYFNSQTADFRTITRGPFPIQVAPARQEASRLTSTRPDATPKETEVIAMDIAYLKPAPGKWSYATSQRLQDSPVLKWLLPLPALLLALTGGIVARRNTLASNVALARRQAAPKAARKQIRRAEAAIRHRDETGFNQALWDALSEYFGHRFNLAPGEVTKQSVLERIPEDTDDIATLFDTVEQRRYGLGTASEQPEEEMKHLLGRLNETLRKCERMKR